MTERWKPIAGYEGRYEVSDLGRVRSLTYKDRIGRTFVGRVLRGNPSRSGHLTVTLSRSRDDRFRFSVHRLVLETFVGPCPPGMECCHFPDPTPSNNALANLRWDTHSENQRDEIRLGRWKRPPAPHPLGEEHPGSKIKEADVLRIFEMRKIGRLYREIAGVLGVTEGAVRSILCRETWAHVDVPEELLAEAEMRRPKPRLGIRGVSFENGKYRARIQLNGKKLNLGTFKTSRAAERAVQESGL